MADNETVLHDRLYADLRMSTSGYPSETHNVRVFRDSDDRIGLHFERMYMSLSVADWRRIAAAVNAVLPAPVTA